MKFRLGKLLWKFTLVLLIVLLSMMAVAAFWLWHISNPDTTTQIILTETRQSLRQQGFKTDVTEFDFSTTPEDQIREAAITNAFGYHVSREFNDHQNLQKIIGSNSIVVVWQDALVKRQYPSFGDNRESFTWDDLREAIQPNQPAINTACTAVLSGPIRFNLDSRGGNAMRLPHLAAMKKLTQHFGTRMVLALHDGDLSSAWTNLQAATRLVTVYDPEPVEVSHLVCFANVKLNFGAIWQALQTNGWSDHQLASLQREWESPDFFKHLPEVAAFQRASVALMCQQERERSFLDGMTPKEFTQKMFRYPQYIWPNLRQIIAHKQYARQGSYVDESNLLKFYHDRETETSHAITAPIWQQMRSLPGATNQVFFRSKYPSRVQCMMNLRAVSTATLKGPTSLLGKAAEAETQRRIIVTGIALERYHLKRGHYPETLEMLVPDILKSLPMDFMDGQPLRYRMEPGQHFLLYSVGLDCVDDGGKMRRNLRHMGFEPMEPLGQPQIPGDIVWPLPASAESWQEEQKLRAEEMKQAERAWKIRFHQQRQDETETEWQQSPLRQSRVGGILATKWQPELDKGFFGGQDAAEYLRNPGSTSNHLTLAELMTPKQVFTGHEPWDLTFEFPVRYDAITNHGFFLLLDAETNSEAMFAPDSGAKAQEQIRAPNGNCLLVWRTIFDPPGKHALQVELTWNNEQGAETWCRGPAIVVTNFNLCQFGLDSEYYDVEFGARFHARLPEKSGNFSIECVTTNGVQLKTLTGSTTNGEFDVRWDLKANDGYRLTGENFNSIINITLPDSGRTQTLLGP
jgi:hypothetical protein